MCVGQIAVLLNGVQGMGKLLLREGNTHEASNCYLCIA